MKYLTFLVFMVIACFALVVKFANGADNSTSWVLLILFVGAVSLMTIEVIRISKTWKQ
tara:strand:+ start:201 stop:374 length:174 start_codon:yes stop_codon:yes gene_type:complete